MYSPKETIKKARETLSRYGMVDPGDLVIVAVSGGSDSVCLLDILNSLKGELAIELVVAHYDHGLRPDEDASETRFVRNLAASLHLPFETEKSTLSLNRGRGSVEERARDARYQYLEGLKNKLRARKIALGHHLNDQAETVLMRLLRGSGPTGLAGIPPSRDDTIIRPLIEIKREEIESYARERGLSFVTDRSNFDTRYLRNRVRLDLLPSLLEYQPRLVEHLGELADILREDEKYLGRLAQEWVEGEANFEGSREIRIPVSSFVELPPALRSRVTRALLRKTGKSLRRITGRHINSVFTLAESKRPQGKINLPLGLSVKKTYDTLAFRIGTDPEALEFLYFLENPGTLHLKEIDRVISVTPVAAGSDLSLGKSKETTYLNGERLRFPLVVRNFRPGDKFVPLGMRGQKKIKDFFIDLKVPSEVRGRVPILLSEDTPVWVCGYRIDERFKATPNGKKILKVTIT